MQRLGGFFARVARRFLPDPFVLACLLTLLVLLTAVMLPQSASLRGRPFVDRSMTVFGMWLDAVWQANFLVFALQMCVVLLTGFGLARAPLATRMLRTIARLARSNRGAVTLVGLVSCVGCWINWGFGLILAGVLAMELRRELGRRGVACQYALIVAAAYSGMMIWHGGLSGSAPLKVASDGVTIETRSESGTVLETVAPIKIDRTILAPANLVLTAALFVGVPLVLRAMGTAQVYTGADSADESEQLDPQVREERGRGRAARTLAERIDENRVLPLALSFLVFAGLYRIVSGQPAAAEGAGFAARLVRAVDLNFINSVFLAVGLLLHRSLASYTSALLDGGKAIVGIVIQFPLYSGIQGVMFGAGLAATVSRWFVEASASAADLLQLSTAQTFPIGTLLSACLVNICVPSGGGQWIVQGPIMCGAAKALGVPLDQTVMAIAFGDQLTNMIQPFWAIPLMGMTRVNPREFMGYCALLMLVAAPAYALALLFY